MSLRSQVSWRSLSFERSQTKKRSNDQREVGHLTTGFRVSPLTAVQAERLFNPCSGNSGAIGLSGCTYAHTYNPLLLKNRIANISSPQTHKKPPTVRLSEQKRDVEALLTLVAC
ncbi:hypothetical protein CIHG_07511 [Coccidioides immitis H538.4]|nr:hypothetical protein CISG_04302 [Coccidioides immitis RMSCC 3703]KMU89704.1 hypothetical protein CIHG_07511 [Coccidioides immitis H538.4]TPX23160.1 hypothetical protein DIZ76_012485 [Coccidioides immitis]